MGQYFRPLSPLNKLDPIKIEDKIAGERRLAFAVIHRAVKDIEDLYDKIVQDPKSVSSVELISARQTYRWIMTDIIPARKISFLWWIAIACPCREREKYYIQECRKIAKEYFPLINATKIS